MPQTERSSVVRVNHSTRTRVEPALLTKEFRQQLLAFRSSNPRIQQLHKDLQQGRNRAPETICAILADAFNDEKPLAEVVSPVKTISDFFAAHAPKLRRRLCELLPLETREEGRMNNTEMRVAQGDLSRPTLVELKREVCELRELLNEMEAAIDAELFGAGPNG